MNRGIYRFGTIFTDKAHGRLLSFALAMGLFLLGAVNLHATTYYTATNGSDSNPGTQSQPFRTLFRGVTVLQPGDTLYVRAGTYPESLYCGITVCIPGGTSWSSPVTVAAYPGETVVIKPSSGVRVLNFEIPGQTYIIIDGLILDGSNVSNDVVQIQESAHHIRIRNSEIRGNGASPMYQGVNIGPTSTFNEIINTRIHDLGGLSGCTTTLPGHAVYIAGDNNLLERSTIYNIGGYGVHGYNGYGTNSNNNTIRYNQVYNIGRCVQTANAAGILIGSGTGNLAYNNISRNNPMGIRIGFTASNSKVYNNTVYQNSMTGIQIDGSSSNAIVRNNIVFGNAANISNSGAGTILSNNISTDPSFVDSANLDFRLRAGSPAINAGMALSEVVDDFSGVARPQGASYDIGAHEYSGTPVASPSNLIVMP